jgi:Mn2+/Fe2+ NRAMP family transporter
VYLLSSIGPTDLIVNSAVGATYGYSLLWTLIVAYGIRYFINEASARYVLASGESIVEGYGRLGRPVVWGFAGAIFLKRHLSNLYLILLLGTSAQMLVPLPGQASSAIWSVVSAGAGFTLMYRGGYKGVEKWSRPLLVAFGGALVLVALISKPDPSEVLRGFFVPAYPGSQGIYSYFLLLTAIVGTSVGSINHLKYPAYVWEKGWRTLYVATKQKTDLVFSVAGQFVLVALIQIAAASVLFGRGVEIRTMEDLALVFSQTLGEPGRILLSLAMWGAVFTTFVASNTGYSLLVADAYERFLARGGPKDDPAARDMKRGWAYRGLLIFFCVSPLYVLFTSWQPFWISIVTAALFVVITPLTMIGLLWITNNRGLLKEHVNKPLSNFVIGCSIPIALFLTYQSVIELIEELSGG